MAFLYLRLFFKGISCSSLIYSAFLHFKQNSAWNGYIVTEGFSLQEKGFGVLFQPLQNFTLKSRISKEENEMWPMFTENIDLSHVSHQKMSWEGSHIYLVYSPIHSFTIGEYFASTYCVLVGLGGQLGLFQISSLSQCSLKDGQNWINVYKIMQRVRNLY